MLGRHLILPHRHHVHLRSAGQEHHIKHVHPQKDLSNCSENPMMNNNEMTPTKKQLRHAIEVNYQTGESIKDLLERWLSQQNLSVENATSRYALHYLQLDHPLKDVINKSENYDGGDTLDFDVELPKIINSLSIVHHLLNEVTKDQPTHHATIFKTIVDKIEHNRSEIRSMLHQTDYCTPAYSYNENHDSLEYGIINEVIKLLGVIRKKYEILLEKAD